jgi:hypothetical protein
MAKYKRRRKNLPIQFTPRFWEDADGRSLVVREVKRQLKLLRTHAAVDSIQKELLCQRAAFISLRLQSMEIAATESGEFDSGVYSNLCNTLLGILKALGLERKLAKVLDLKSYVKDRDE